MKHLTPILLLILTLFSCSHKTTNTLEQRDSLLLSHATTTTTTAYDSLYQRFDHLQTMMDSINSYWSTHKTITYYSTPDSLGNQYVTHVEEADSQGGSTHLSTTTTQDSTTVIEASASTTTTTDTLYINRTIRVKQTKTVTSIPWYYKYSTYTLCIFTFFFIIYIIWRKRLSILSVLQEFFH